MEWAERDPYDDKTLPPAQLLAKQLLPAVPACVKKMSCYWSNSFKSKLPTKSLSKQNALPPPFSRGCIDMQHSQFAECQEFSQVFLSGQSRRIPDHPIRAASLALRLFSRCVEVSDSRLCTKNILMQLLLYWDSAASVHLTNISTVVADINHQALVRCSYTNWLRR